MGTCGTILEKNNVYLSLVCVESEKLSQYIKMLLLFSLGCKLHEFLEWCLAHRMDDDDDHDHDNVNK